MGEITGWQMIDSKKIRVGISYDLDEILYDWVISEDHLDWEIANRACAAACAFVPIEPWKSAKSLIDTVESIIFQAHDGDFTMAVSVLLELAEEDGE